MLTPLQPQDTLPIHPVYNVADWDDPQGAVDWSRFSSFLEQVKRTGIIPGDHNSHDHMNIQKEVSFDNTLIQSWRQQFLKLQSERGVRIRWVMVDGFLLYWHKVCARLQAPSSCSGVPPQASVDTLDIRFLLRVPRDVLVQRRIDRQGYFTAGEASAPSCLEPPSNSLPRSASRRSNFASSTSLRLGSLSPLLLSPFTLFS